MASSFVRSSMAAPSTEKIVETPLIKLFFRAHFDVSPLIRTNEYDLPFRSSPRSSHAKGSSILRWSSYSTSNMTTKHSLLLRRRVLLRFCWSTCSCCSIGESFCILLKKLCSASNRYVKEEVQPQISIVECKGWHGEWTATMKWNNAPCHHATRRRARPRKNLPHTWSSPQQRLL